MKWLRTVAIIGFASFGIACSGGGNGSSETGQFVDSEVQGLRYVGDTFAGTTDAGGRYQFEPGDEVCFFLGLIPLGCGEASGVFTPIELFEGSDSDDCRVRNLVRFLLSLDADGDPANGIDLRGVETIAADAESIDFDQDCDDFGDDEDVLDFVDEWGFDGDLVSEEDAEIHFDESLDESDYFEQALLGRWMYTAYDGGDLSGARVMNINRQTLDEIDADVDEEGEVEFELEGDEPGEVCEHDGDFEGREREYIFGSVECGSGEPVAALTLVVELGGKFRMDRLDSSVEYATSDLIGVWSLMTSFTEGDSIEIGEETLAEISANVGSGGAVSLSVETEIGESVEVCALTGQMNVSKSFVSGRVSCSESGAGFFSMGMDF